MAERKVTPTPMDVDLLTQVTHGHGGALDVPAGSARSERGRPRRLIRPRATPQRKVEKISLGIGSDRPQQALIAQLAQHRRPAAMRQPPESLVGADIEI